MNIHYQKPDLGRVLDVSHPLARGLVGCWLFNEGTGGRVSDLSGNDNHGTINGASWTRGKAGHALSFDLTANIEIGSNLPLDSNEDITVSAWVTPNALEVSHQNIVSKLDGDTWHFLLAIRSNIESYSNQVEFYFPIPSDRYGWIISTNEVVVGGLSHIVGVKSGSTGKIYLNGDREVLALEDDSPDGMSDDNPLWIGSDYDDSYPLNGVLDNVSIYNRALLDSEVAWLYQEPYAMIG